MSWRRTHPPRCRVRRAVACTCAHGRSFRAIVGQGDRGEVLTPTVVGPRHAFWQSMNRIAFKVDGKNGQFVTATVLSSHHRREPKLGVWDWCVICFFLLAVTSLIGLLITA